LHLLMKYGVYPLISGHKNRFAIKFMAFENGQACTQDVEFELAVCS
ncbi:cell division protein ZapD, partial [Vibrio alginolyticus]|nr:cell division protein ZapD [Vibrio alginolyticus]